MLSFHTCRIAVALVCFAAAASFAAALLLSPALPSWPYGSYLAVLLVTAGIGLPRQSWPAVHKATIFATLAALAAWPFAVIYRAFGQVDMISVLFHAEAGTAGANLSMMQEPITLTALCLLTLVLCAHWLSQSPRLWLFPWALAGGLIFSNPLVVYKLQALTNPLPELDLNAARITPQLKPPQVLPDIIYIYLEGTDRRFFLADPALPKGHSQDLAAQALHDLASKGLSFTAIRQITGTGWSMAGMVASQCGLPLLPRGALLNALEDQLTTAFMPKIECLGDVLRREGYDLVYLMGAKADFAGTRSFYETHGYQSTITSVDLAKAYPDQIKNAYLGWVYDDELVYHAALDALNARLSEPAPIMITLATIGPHGVPNYLSRSCDTAGQSLETADAALSVSCLIALSTKFIAEAQKAHAEVERGRELRIILQSDHFYHRPFNWPDHITPSNTVILINGNSPETQAVHERASGQKIADLGSMIDVYPTLLDWLGFEWQGKPDQHYAAGLGVSLISAKADQALAARYDADILDRIIMQNMPLFSALWDGSH